MAGTCRHARGERRCSRDCCQDNGISPVGGTDTQAEYRDEFVYELYSPDLHSTSSAHLLCEHRFYRHVYPVSLTYKEGSSLFGYLGISLGL